VEITPRKGLWHLPPGAALTVQYERYVSTTGFESAILTSGIRIPVK
jgi:hypothetical protein